MVGGETAVIRLRVRLSSTARGWRISFLIVLPVQAIKTVRISATLFGGYPLTRSSNPLVSGMATTAVSFHTGSSVFIMVRVLNFSRPSLPSFTVTNGSLLPVKNGHLVKRCFIYD